MLKYRNYQDMYVVICNNLMPKLYDLGVNAVFAVPRSGAIPAAMIATLLHVPLGFAGQDALSGRRIKLYPGNSGDKVLIVDDSIHGGRAMQRAIKTHSSKGRIISCAIFASPHSKDKVDFFGEILPAPRLFEWNMWGIEATTHFMCDMDGVLCKDPKPYDDDGLLYQKALENAAPKFLPKVPIHSICTNRIERWRGITEKRRKVDYGELIMQPYKTAAERRRISDPAKFKASIFEKRGAFVFIESHDHIAAKMINYTEKPVLSIQSGKVYG